MTVPVIVLTNGRRDCIFPTIASVQRHLLGAGDMVIVDDSGDSAYRVLLMSEFEDATVVSVAEEAAGYWRAMQTVWRVARDSGADAIWFHEDDFILNEDVAVAPMCRVLKTNTHLTQMSLLRQPWFWNEQIAGGLIQALERQGQTFAQRTSGIYDWVEHRACFTGNPSLIPRRTFERDWPEGDWSESRFGADLFLDPRVRGAYWGRYDDPPRVEHIGRERVGHDY